MYRPVSRFAESIISGLASGKGSKAARIGRLATSHLGEGARTSRAVSGFSRGLSGLGSLASKRSFYVPFGIGALGLGTVSGFSKEVLNSPQGYSVMSSMVAQGQPPSPLGAPLRSYQDYDPNSTLYPSWRIPTQDPLKATGELALAMFATRHGR